MSYSQVKTPRFYVDYVQYLNSMGVCAEPVVAEQDGTYNLESSDPQLMGKAWGLTNYKSFALTPEGINGDKTGGVIRRVFSTKTSGSQDELPIYGLGEFLTNCNYIALFGHNFSSLGLTFRVLIKAYNVSTGSDIYAEGRTLTPIYNCSIYGADNRYATANNDGVCILGFDGFQLSGFDDISTTAVELHIEPGDPTTGSWNDTIEIPQISSISMGKYFDMPMSPDLELSQTTLYETKRHTTKGGKVLSKPVNMRRPNFGATSQFDSSISNLARTGRKSWELKYSLLKDTDIMGYNENSSMLFSESRGDYDTTQLNANQDKFNYALNGETNNTDFFSNVLHLTQGRLPFIFQPDNTSFGTSDFNICSFDQNSFEHRQVGFKTYETSLSITESW